MVTINKNNLVNSENISLRKNKVFKEDLDGVFAELFSLVDMENIEMSDETNKSLLEANLNNKVTTEFEKNNFVTPEDSDENILAAAQSLVSLFYKELNLDSSDSELNENKIFNAKDIHLENQKSFKDPKIIYKIETNEPELKTLNSDLEKDKNFLITKENSQILSKKTKFLENNQKDFQHIKNSFNGNENKKDVKKTPDQQILNNNEKLVGSRELSVKKSKNEISKKKINKSKMNYENIKIDVKFENKEMKNSKEFAFNFHNSFSQHKEQKSQINHVGRTNSNKNQNSKALINNLENQKNITDKSEFLDLMESAWGEKFVKIVKNHISRGINRINISLEPKNLGKLMVEVEVTGKDTELKILSDNKQTITILNENSQRLNEMFKEDNLKLSNFSTMLNQNNDNSKNKNSEKRTDNFDKKIEDKVQIEKNKEIINTKKSNHKVDKIA